MRFPKIYFILLCFTFCTAVVFGQLGPHPSTIKWQQIDLSKVRVIFPKDFDQQGLRMANLLNYMEQNHKRSIGDLSEKINVVLHNRTVIPNGFVGFAPFRSEFFATPPQSANLLGTIDWLDGLAVHEYRHALQFSNSKVGLSKLLYFLQGGNGWALAASASIPNWFWEGDATIMETALTKSGRGRTPFFTLEQRALLLNGVNYSYTKARNGSYKDLVPDHYHLGYVLLMHGREQYGNDFWQPIFDKAAKYKPLLYPFSNALKQATGLTTKAWYKQTYQNLTTKWTTQVINTVLSPSAKVPTKRKKTVTHYRFPFKQKDGSLLCLKSSYRKTDALVQIKNGKEKVLTNVGFHIEKYLSIVGSKAIWTEYERDPRRSYKNYSNLICYDLKTRIKTRLTTEGRYFSPSFSYSKGRIVAVKITPEQDNSLVILNASTGTITNIIPNPDNHFLTFPKWAENDTDIIYIAKKANQLAIFKYNLINQTTLQLSDWTHHTLDELYIKNNAVYFTSSFSGIDNIYKIDLDQPRQIKQVTSDKIGAYFPSLNVAGDTLFYSTFTPKGYELRNMRLANYQLRNQLITVTEPHVQPYYSINSNNEEGGDILEKVPTENYPIKRYKGLLKGMQLHSWNFYPSVSLPTLDIQFDNYLNDFSINLIGGYNLNEKSPIFVTSATYGKWYPQITAFTSLTNRNTIYLDQQDSLRVQSFDQFSVGGRTSIPLVWLRGDYSTALNLFGGYTHRYLSDVQFGNKELQNDNLGTFQLGFNFSSLRRTALQNLGPRWGQRFSLVFQQTTNGENDRQIRLNGRLYFPGIGANHSLQLGVAYQKESLKNEYQFSDSFEYPRGFGGILNDEFLKLSADYHVPLFYPDWGFGGIAYLKRVSLNAFFDFGKRQVNFVDLVDNHNSVGAEVIFDTQFWNELPVTLGIRNAYLLTRETDQLQVEFFVRNFIVE